MRSGSGCTVDWLFSKTIVARPVAVWLCLKPLRFTGAEIAEVIVQGADRRGDRHAVVVQDNDEPTAQAAGMVHRFPCHAAGDGAVADHRDHVIVAAGEIARQRHAKSG